ncbi:MAG: hypothetical protein OEV86_15150 [Candidatus Krumholzibacteria bacterium]|nr:hypothetical protein [Candidatus Krumholzibacteria bacterium]
MIALALVYYGLALLPVCAGVAWCEWADRHDNARRERERERAYQQAADDNAEALYRAAVRRHVNEPLRR